MPTYGDERERSNVGLAAALRVQIEGNPGYVAMREWDRVGLTKQVLDSNVAELVELLEPFESRVDLALEVFREDADPDLLDSLTVETTRCLHNYVASVKSLVEHTRKVQRKQYEGEQFRHEYESRKDSLITHPVAKFVQDLRDYMLHYRLPRMIGSFQLPAGTAVVCMLRDDLGQWPNWSAPARRWLLDQPQRIPVRQTVQQYDDLVAELYEWLWTVVSREHHEQMKAVGRLHAQLQGLYEGSVLDPADPEPPYRTMTP